MYSCMYLCVVRARVHMYVKLTSDLSGAPCCLICSNAWCDSGGVRFNSDAFGLLCAEVVVEHTGELNALPTLNINKELNALPP